MTVEDSTIYPALLRQNPEGQVVKEGKRSKEHERMIHSVPRELSEQKGQVQLYIISVIFQGSHDIVRLMVNPYFILLPAAKEDPEH